MAWPIDDLTTDKLDEGTDKLREARVEIYNAVVKLKELLAWGGGDEEVATNIVYAFTVLDAPTDSQLLMLVQATHNMTFPAGLVA